MFLQEVLLCLTMSDLTLAESTSFHHSEYRNYNDIRQ